MEHFVDRCHKFGLKITPQRCAVYKELIQSNNHPTAEQMFHSIQKDFPNISFDTVNRTLLTLVEIGLVEVVQTKDASRRFDAILDSHHHFNCVNCGKIIDFDHEEFDRLKVPERLQNECAVFAKRVVLTGLCRECHEKRKEQNISF